MAIISKKPPRYDDDGEMLEEHEINKEADAEAALRDPYHGIELDSKRPPKQARWNLRLMCSV